MEQVLGQQAVTDWPPALSAAPGLSTRDSHSVPGPHNSPVALLATSGTGNRLRAFKYLPQGFTASTWLIWGLTFGPFDL